MKCTPIKYFLRTLISWLLLIQMVNLSMDPVDKLNFKNGRGTTEEDLTINEIESVYEFVAEGMFDEDVPESDENDEDAFIKIFNIDYYLTATAEITPVFVPAFAIKYNPFYQDSSCMNYAEPSSPPPKQA